MGKIKKDPSAKHNATRPPAILFYVGQFSSIKIYDLPQYIDSFPQHYKGDLYHWIDVLNRFDHILELLIKEYGLGDGPQTVPFSRKILLRGDLEPVVEENASDSVLDELRIPHDGDRLLAEKILSMTRHLLENCTNRGVYASTDRLNDLLNTTSLSLLESTLRIGHRVAQRYSGSRLRTTGFDLPPVNYPLLAASYQLSLERVERIAQPWPRKALDSTKEPRGEKEVLESSVITLTTLLTDSESAERNRREVCVQLLNDINAATNGPEAIRPPTSPTSPTPHTRVDTSDSGKEPFTISLKRLETSALHPMVVELVANSPHEHLYPSFQKLLLAWNLKHGQEACHGVVAIRLLAMANLMHIYPESMLKEKLLFQDAEEPRRFHLPYQLADLVHPPADQPSPIPKHLQTYALVVLESLTNNKNGATDVCTALSVNVNHGILSYAVRKAVAQLTSDAIGPQEIEDAEWREALFSLLSTLPKNHGQMAAGFVGAGVLDLLVEALQSRTSQAELDHPRILYFLDLVVYISRDSFTSLVNANGLDAVSKLLSFEVDRSMTLVQQGKGLGVEWRAPATDFQIPHTQQTTLRALLKFVNHMMSINGGPFDRVLRNLIESSQLLGSLRSIILNPHIYGSSIWSGTVNVFSSFINNEPTSYAAIAEAGLTRAILETITQKPVPSSASGEEALDLFPEGVTDAELNSVQTVSDHLSCGLLPSTEAIAAAAQAFSAICLNDAGMQQVQTSQVLRVFFRIFISPQHVKALFTAAGSETEQLGAAFDELARHYPRLKSEIVGIVAKMAGSIARLSHILAAKHRNATADSESGSHAEQVEAPGPQDDDVEMSDAPTQPLANSGSVAPSMLNYVVVFSNFLTGFFTNTALCTPFAETDGIERILDVASAPSLPYEFGVFGTPHKLIRVIQVLADQKPHLTLPSLVTRAQEALATLAPFINHPYETSYFARLVNSTKPSNKGKVTLNHGGGGSEIIKALAVTEMLCTVLTKSHSPLSSRSTSSSFSTVNLADMYARLVEDLGRLQTHCIWENMLMKRTFRDLWSKPQANGLVASNEVQDAPDFGNTGSSTSSDPISNGLEDKDVEVKGFQVLRQVLNNTPSAISNLMQSIGKTILPRRMPTDSYQKQNTIFIADHIAQALVDQLSFSPPTGTDSKAIDYYRMVTISLMTRALIDTRTDSVDRSVPQVLTLLLQSLKNKGGLSLLGSTAQSFFDNIVALANDAETNEDARERHGYALEGLKSVLQFFSHITNHKVVLDAHQSSALASRSERERDRPEYFSPQQFLVEVRLSVMQSIAPIWKSDQLKSTKSFIVKSLLEIVQHVLEGQSEHGAFKRSDKVPQKQKATYKMWRLNNPDYVMRLVEKGYDRELAREALYRCSGHQTTAQEYCAAYRRDPQLTRHPVPPYDYSFPSDQDAEMGTSNSGNGTASSEQDQNAQPDDLADGLPNVAQLLGAIASAPFPDAASLSYTPDAAPPSEPRDDAPSEPNGVKAAEDPAVVTVDDLDEQRAHLRGQLMDRCLTILSIFDDLTFDLAALIVAAVSKAKSASMMRQEIGETLLQSLVSYQIAKDWRLKAKQISTNAHLLGIILQDSLFFDAARDLLHESFEFLLIFITVPDHQKPEDFPSWMPQVLLIIERFLAEDAQPHQIRWEQPDPEQPLKEQPIAQQVKPMVSPEGRMELFSRIIDLLHRVGKNASLGLAFARILVLLTRDRAIATRLGQKKNMQRLFVMVKQLSGVMDDKLQTAFMLILRHIVEDEETIRQIMRSEIRALFEQQPRHLDTTAYTRTLAHLALRAPDLFVEATNEMVTIPRYDRSQTPQALALKKEDPPSDQELSATAEEANQDAEHQEPSSEAQPPSEMPNTLERTKTLELKPPVVENPDGVIHYLLSELLSYKDVEDTEPKTTPSGQDADTTSNDTRGATDGHSSESTASKPFKTDEHPIFVYRCFILQCLSELLQSYNRTKVEFINFSRKADPQAATPSKPRSSVLNYLLNVLIPTGAIQQPHDVSSKKKNATSNWAISVVVSLCARTTEKSSSSSNRRDQFEDEEPDLTFVRRFVLEHALRAYKDANASSESFEHKYSKLLSFADLFNRMLAGRPGAHAFSRRHEVPSENLVPSQKQLAKIMFEKNFIAALTSSISDIDLNVSGAHRVVKYILRPLKLLSHTAIELSLSSETASSLGQTDEEEISSATSVSEAGGDREDTPDLFRNSTLGMFDPQRGNGDDESGSEDDDEGDMYADYTDPMEDVDEDGSEDDQEMDDMDAMEGLPGDVVEVEVDYDEDDDESEDDLDSSESSDDIDHDEVVEDDIEMMGEVTGDDENASDADQIEGEWEDGDDEDGIGYENIDDPEVALEMGGEAPLSESESDSEGDGLEPAYNDAALNEPMEEGMALEVDHEGGLHEDSDEDDNDEEEDYDEDEVAYAGPGFEDEDADMPPFVLGWAQAAGRRPGHQLRHQWSALHRDRGLMSMFQALSRLPAELADVVEVPGGYRSHRPGGSARNEEGLNPLLSRPAQDSPVRRPFSRPQMARPSLLDMQFGRISDFGALGRGLTFPGGNAAAYISDLINVLGNPPPMPPGTHGHQHHHHAHTHYHQHFGPGGELHLTIPIGAGFPRGLEDLLNMNNNAAHQNRNESAEPSEAVNFSPNFTSERWKEETRLIFGNASAEKCLHVVNAILRCLVPPAMEEDRIRKIKAEEERKQEEERAKIKAEREAQERKEREEREAAEREAAAAEEAERAARAAEERQVTEEGANVDASAEVTAGSAMEGVESSNIEGAAEDDNATGPAEPQARVFANIRGRELDITNLGIDTAYLEALPEDMREEVITMQIAEQRSQAAAGGQQSSATNREFLDEFLNALPADIREEILQQEAQDRRRREREEARRQAAVEGVPARAEEMDPASFMASLDPILRQSVLAEADEDTLAQLPPDLAQEARILSGHAHRRTADPNRFVDDDDLNQFLNRRRNGNVIARPAAEGKAPRRVVIQMLDKSAIATLLRLMFASLHSSSRQNLNGILRNACCNHQTRGEIVNGLLSILQDGSADTAATERSFAQLTLRSKQPTAAKSPVSTKKLQQDSSFLCAEASPVSVTSHCLAALVFLTQSITNLPKFFITEHDFIGMSRSKSGRKGKARESKAGKYPINALLSLLDRHSVVDNSSVNEQLSGLLDIVSRPLIALSKKDKDSETLPPEESFPEAVDSQPPAVSEDQQLPDAPAEAEGAAQASEAEPEAETTAPPTTDQDASKENDKASEPKKPLEPPEIPEEHLRLVVNILTARDCSAKTFQSTLSTINNMSSIPGAREVFGQELVKRARALGDAIQSDLEKLISALGSAENEMDAQSSALTNFSPAGSDQAKLNRILTALDYLFDSKTSATKENAGQDDLLSGLYDDTSFGALWNQLSACLSAIQQSDQYFFNVATILLPLVEALMVVCKTLGTDDGKAKSSDTPIRNIFFAFTNTHKKVLNDLVRHNPKLMSGSFSVLVKNSSVLEFDNKRNYFNRRLHHRTPEQRHFPHPTLQLNIRREQVFTDSFQALCFKRPEEIKYGKLNIRFHNEEGVDAGGVTREWFQVLARQMFDASYALFNPVASDRTTFHPNSLSGVNDLHLQYFKFIGRIIGKALYENRVLDCHFSRAVYKRILGKSVSMKDMETLDLEFTKSLQWMLENDITDVITETFSVEKDNFGSTETIDLIDDGRNVPVTEENKHEYVRLLVEYRLTGSVQEQLEAFLGGFHDIVPAELISIFDEGELELLISGMPEVDIDDWRNNTDYHNYNASSPQIQWFWRAVRSFDKEERAKLLQFVTGTGKVPLNGFKELEGMNGFTRFIIHKDYGDKERLPSSHTCFNQLDLPEYESYETLRKQLYTAMTTGNEFFGFA